MHHCLNVVTEPDGRARGPARSAPSSRVEGSTRCARPARPLRRGAPSARRTRGSAAGPGLVAAAFGIDRALHRPRPVRPGVAAAPRGAPGRRAGAGDRGDPAHRHRLRRGAVGLRPVAVRRRRAARRSAVARPPRPRPERRHGRPLDRPARVPGRPRPAGREDVVRPVAPPRRGARAVGRPGHRRARPRRDRPGPRAAPGAARRRDRRRARHRAVGRPGGPGRAPRRRAVPRDRRDARRGGAPRDVARRGAARRCCATSAAGSTRCRRCASTLARSFDPAGELLDTASPRLGPLRAAVRVAYDRLRRRLDSPRRLGARRRAPGADRHAAQRALRRPGPRRGPEPGSRASSTTRRAAARRCSSSRWWSWSWATPGARRRRPSTRRRAGSSTSCRRSSAPTARCCARRSRRSPSSTSGPPRRSSRPSWTASVPTLADRTEVVLLSARHPGLTGRVVPIDLRLGDGYTALVITGPEHGRQDRRAADAGPAVPDAPGRPPRPRRGGLAAAGAAATCSRTSATSSRSPSRCPPSRATCARSSGSSSTPAPGRSCCSTSWAPAPTRPRARRWPRRCSTTSSAPGALVAATTHYAEIKVYAHETARGPQRVGGVRPRDAVADLPAHDRPARAAARRSRSPSGSACPRRSSPTRAAA